MGSRFRGSDELYRLRGTDELLRLRGSYEIVIQGENKHWRCEQGLKKNAPEKFGTMSNFSGAPRTTRGVF